MRPGVAGRAQNLASDRRTSSAAPPGTCCSVLTLTAALGVEAARRTPRVAATTPLRRRPRFVTLGQDQVRELTATFTAAMEPDQGALRPALTPCVWSEPTGVHSCG